MWFIIIGILVLAAGAWYLQRLSNDKMLLTPGNEMVNPGRFFTVAVKKVDRLKEQTGYDQLTRVQKSIYSIDQLYVQLGNSGNFAALIANMPDCRFVLDVPNSFRAIGAVQIAGIVQQMISVIGTECLLADIPVRKKRLNSLTPQQKNSLQQAEASFRSCSDNWLMLLAKYVADKREDFDYHLE